MARIKVTEASGAVLNWLVAKCEGYELHLDDEVSGPWLAPSEGFLHDEKPLSAANYSTDWAQGGPILERKKIGVYPSGVRENMWAARTLTLPHIYGPTPLIAAMRCYVTSELGQEVEVPDELLK